MRSKFADKYDNPLRDGLYFAEDGHDGDLLHINVSRDGNTFSAESYEGVIHIKDMKLFSKQLIRLSDPLSNLEFAISKFKLSY